MRDGHSLLPLPDTHFSLILLTLSDHIGSESDRHPISIGSIVVVGIAIVVDIAGISRVAAAHHANNIPLLVWSGIVFMIIP